MKTLIAAMITLIFLFTAPAFAKGPGGEGKGSHNGEDIKTHRGVMGEKAGDKAVNIREMEQEKLERAEEVQEEKQEKVKEKSQKTKKGLEKQREKKAEQVQKELDKGSEKGQEAREARKKWWRFWGEGE
ncbi:MAG: hypothetical protein KJ550_12555 [Proteobacteria bacterium]|nr:hypothetical protein [Desulfobacteraceae bacterium]MBU4014275.1 hypothetical protein [Pseudomonadota bacterium]MBU4208481.1 hypothetical protein [Pseudomonadota bacterium]